MPLRETCPRDFTTIPEGYPKLAALISKDQDWAIFRKFKELNARNLLGLQSEVVDLEAQLQALDDDLGRTRDGASASWKAFCSEPVRAELALRIRKTLSEYNSALLQYGELLKLSAPSSDTTTLFRMWLRRESDGKQSPSSDDDLFLYHQLPQADFKYMKTGVSDSDAVDLASLSRKADSWLASRVQRNVFISSLFMRDLIKYRYNGDDYCVSYFSTPKVNKMVTAIACLVITILAVGAMVSLYYMPDPNARLALVCLFVLLCAGILAICGASKSEVIMGTVGFAAVLVVFISSTPQA
jgi:hypothetical protein